MPTTTTTTTVPPASRTIPDEVINLATKLYDLARSGDATTLSTYLSSGAPANLTNQNGDTLLMLAAYHGHVHAVEVLLDRGADPNRVNDRGQTPLAGAVFKGFRDVVKALVDAGADPHAGTPSAVDAARIFKRDDFAVLFESAADAEPSSP